MARLKAKRFRQIFNYLDQDQDGVIDLLDLTTGQACLHVALLATPSSPDGLCISALMAVALTRSLKIGLVTGPIQDITQLRW